MAGYCGLCNEHYECGYEEHDQECPGEDRPSRDPMAEFNDYAQRAGLDNAEAERVWNEEIRPGIDAGNAFLY